MKTANHPPRWPDISGISHLDRIGDHEGFSLDEGFSFNKRKILRDHGNRRIADVRNRGCLSGLRRIHPHCAKPGRTLRSLRNTAPGPVGRRRDERRAARATAFAHRHQHFSIAAYAPGPSPSFDARWETIRPSLDDLYLNFETTFIPRRLTEAFPPATLRRLREIKRKVDPDNVFNQNFPVA